MPRKEGTIEVSTGKRAAAMEVLSFLVDTCRILFGLSTFHFWSVIRSYVIAVAS